VGDPNIKPERQTEVEAGVDAAVLSGRASVSVTVYQKTVSDLLLEQTLRPSTGLLTRVFNGGKLRNRGLEIAAAYSPIQRADLSWIVRGTFFMNRSKILELAAGIDSFQTTAGFSRSLGAYQIQIGRSATQIVGSEGLVGDASPDFQMSFSTDVDYRAWSFGMLWDWKKGGDVVNLTQLLYDAGQTSPDYVSAGAARITAWATGTTKVYVQDASYLKLRELTASYTLPGTVTSALFGRAVRHARLNVAGRNLLRFTPYKGLDPEVSNFANQAIARNIDVAPFPPSRSFFFSVDLDF
jgi:outer membrane receptor protein involved in Fe transport